MKTQSKKKSTKPKKAKKVVAEIVDDQESPEAALSNSENISSFDNSDFESSLEKDFDSQDDIKIESSKSLNSKSLTTTDPVTQYMAEVRKYPLLSKEQEFELAKKYYETKDPQLAQALITANLRFVVKVAAEYSKFGARLIDLIQEGNMGLMHAVRDFNPYKGVRLITYAVWWIRGYIQEYLMKQYSMVKIGTTHNQKKLFYQLQKEKRELDALGEAPDIKLISSKLDIPEDEVAEMTKRMSGRDISLDQPLDTDSSSTIKDFQRNLALGPDAELESKEEIELLKQKIEKLRPTLNNREKILLEERLLADEPLTLQEIGEKYGITREAVRQAEQRLMNKIKDLYFQK